MDYCDRPQAMMVKDKQQKSHNLGIKCLLNDPHVLFVKLTKRTAP